MSTDPDAVARDDVGPGDVAPVAAHHHGPLRSSRRPRSRGVLTALLVLVVVAAGAWVAVARDLWPLAAADPTDAPTTPAATAPVERRTVTATQQADGTLGYAGTRRVVNQVNGTLTWLPSAGDVLRPGDVLYRVDGEPVVLLKGTVPAWRDLTSGTSGPDAQQLNAALVALGYADGLALDPDEDTVTWRTRAAVANLQDDLGLVETGTLQPGRAVFLPGAVRVTAVPGALGAPAGPGQAVLEGTSTRPQVATELPVGLAEQVAVGDRVSISLPDLRTAQGKVTSVGSVANRPEDGGSATIPVRVALVDPAEAGVLDQAPVQVAITTAKAKDVLAVPVTALLAVDDGYAVEVADAAGGGTGVVPVDLGLFDSAGGVVQVDGAGLDDGDRVVVPS